MVPFYLDVDGATHQANFDTNTQAHLRLVALTMRDSGGTTLYSAAWIPSDGRSWVACNGVNYADLLQFFAKWQEQGMEMKLVTSTETLFSAVMEATNTGTQFNSNLTDGPVSSSGTTPPVWVTAIGTAPVGDGTTGLAWLLVSIGAPAAWVAEKLYARGALVTDSNGNLQQAKTAGTSGMTPPVWAQGSTAVPVTDGANGLSWILVSIGAPAQWADQRSYAQGALVTDSNGNLQQAETTLTLANAINTHQQLVSNLAARAIAIYGVAGVNRRYAVVFEPCQENWTIRQGDVDAQWDTDAVTTEAISAFFNDLRYRPTLLTYSAEGSVVSVFRDNSIGADNWTASNGVTASAITATYNCFNDRGLWPLSLSVNPTNDTFACVMVTTETPLQRQWSVVGSDIADLGGKLDPLIQNLMQSPTWPAVGHPRVISIAIGYQQRLMFAKAYTWAEPTYPIATPTSLFRMASCSKPITSTAIGRLLQDGLLADTDTVAMIGLTPAPIPGPPTPEFAAAFDSITINELRTHRTGLQPTGGSDATIAAAYGHPTPISIYESVAYSMTNATISLDNWNGAYAGFPSSTTLQVWYANCNYALLGLIARTATKGLYTTYVQEKIFSALGLTRPYVGASLHSQRATLEVQHHSSYPSSVGQNWVTADPPYVGSGYGTGDSENFEAFEDWSISTVDYASILAAIGVANPGNYPILNSASIATMFTKIDPTGVQDNFTLGGLFWETSQAGATVFAHDGGWSTGGLNIASWVISRSDGISATVFMNMDDPGPFGNFAWGLGPEQLQGFLDCVTWPATGDLFPSFGIASFLLITTTALPRGIVGTSYSVTIAAAGGTTPYVFSISRSSPPPGLTLNSSGVISGTPTGNGGTASFTVQATDSSTPPQVMAAALAITVYTALGITTTSLPAATKGIAYSETIAAGGGESPYALSLNSGSLPAGLAIDRSSGLISGTPSGPRGTASFTVQVTDSSSPPQTATANLSIKVH